MENKVTMPALVAMLALTTGQQKKLCEDFLKELFAIIEEELTSGGNVRIRDSAHSNLWRWKPVKVSMSPLVRTL